jgi:hypothetical protein
MLHLNRKSSSSSTNYPKTIQVSSPQDCPDPCCTITLPHSYTLLKTIPPCPPNTPRLSIARFKKETNPFPQCNRWEITEDPGVKLDGGKNVYVRKWGKVTLLRLEEEEEGFVIFRSLDEEGEINFEMAARREWCYHEGKLTLPQKIALALKNLWRKRHSLIRPRVIRLLTRK